MSWDWMFDIGQLIFHFFKGLDGGASNNINRRKNRLNRSLVTPSGDSADGELSEDEASGQSGDRTATSSTKKLHKKSPKKSHFSSISRNRKVKDRSEKVTKKSLRFLMNTSKMYLPMKTHKMCLMCHQNQ